MLYDLQNFFNTKIKHLFKTEENIDLIFTLFFYSFPDQLNQDHLHVHEVLKLDLCTNSQKKNRLKSFRNNSSLDKLTPSAPIIDPSGTLINILALPKPSLKTFPKSPQCLSALRSLPC